jgi:hypothetical protein
MPPARRPRYGLKAPNSLVTTGPGCGAQFLYSALQICLGNADCAGFSFAGNKEMGTKLTDPDSVGLACFISVAGYTGGHCTNECVGQPSWASDGWCDDGGPGSQYSGCALGSDCADCGVARNPEPGVHDAAYGYVTGEYYTQSGIGVGYWAKKYADGEDDAILGVGRRLDEAALAEHRRLGWATAVSRNAWSIGKRAGQEAWEAIGKSAREATKGVTKDVTMTRVSYMESDAAQMLVLVEGMVSAVDTLTSFATKSPAGMATDVAAMVVVGAIRNVVECGNVGQLAIGNTWANANQRAMDCAGKLTAASMDSMAKLMCAAEKLGEAACAENAISVRNHSRLAQPPPVPPQPLNHSFSPLLRRSRESGCLLT